METKRCWRTSEFWGTVLVNLGAVLAGVTSLVPAEYVTLVNAVSIGMYAVSRGMAKSGVKPE